MENTEQVSSEESVDFSDVVLTDTEESEEVADDSETEQSSSQESLDNSDKPTEQPPASEPSWEDKAREMGWVPAQSAPEPATTNEATAPVAEDEFDIEASVERWEAQALEEGKSDAWVAAQVAREQSQFEGAKLQHQQVLQSFEQTLPAYKQDWAANGLPKEAFDGYAAALRKMGPAAITSAEGQGVAIRLALGDYALKQIHAQKAGAKESEENKPTSAKPGPTATTASGGNTAPVLSQFADEDRKFLAEFQRTQNNGKALTMAQIKGFKDKGLIS